MFRAKFFKWDRLLMWDSLTGCKLQRKSLFFFDRGRTVCIGTIPSKTQLIVNVVIGYA
jgi:hypothetical protein